MVIEKRDFPLRGVQIYKKKIHKIWAGILMTNPLVIVDILVNPFKVNQSIVLQVCRHIDTMYRQVLVAVASQDKN